MEFRDGMKRASTLSPGQQNMLARMKTIVSLPKQTVSKIAQIATRLETVENV